MFGMFKTPIFKTTIEPADQKIDLKRRFFVFGATAVAASLILPAPKHFFIAKPPELLIVTPLKPFDLPTQQMLSLLKKLDEQVIEMTAIPRWLVTDQKWYDQMVAEERAHGR